VHREIAEQFTTEVARRARELKLGNPLDWDVEIGPMTSDEQYEIVVELVEDAVAAGAEKLCGGPIDVPGLPGNFIAPVVLSRVTHEMRIMNEEIFGPVLPIVVVDSDEQAIALANDSEFGLGASVWTADRQKGERIGRQIESGMVWINDHSYSHGACQCSWGGVKDSGLGRSHSKFGFYECVNIKLMAWDPAIAKDMWWHPYDESLGKAVSSSARMLYGRNGQRVAALREGLAPLIKVTGRMLRRNGSS
jgi:acyl-CoA reductase-like NAD-dependent aldehyde dehydrogenase